MKKGTKNLFLVFVLLLALAILIGYFFNWVNNLFFHFTSDRNQLSEFHPVGKFVLIIIIAPFMETLIFQYVPNIMLNKLKIHSTVLLVLLPAFLFGCMHFYFWLYAVMAFLGGIIINVLYLYSKEHSKYFLLIVFAFHSLYNLYGYLFIN